MATRYPRTMVLTLAAGASLVLAAEAEARGAGGFSGGSGGRGGFVGRPGGFGGGFGRSRGHWGHGGFGHHRFGYRHGWHGGRFGYHGRFGYDRRFGFGGRFGRFHGGGLPYAYGPYGYGGYGGDPGFYRGGRGPISSQPTVGIPPSPVLPPAVYVIGKQNRAGGGRPIVRSGRGVLTTD